MKSQITSNYVDVVGRRICAARISFSNTITDIEVIDEYPRRNLPYCMPGFIDSHVHIESSMLTPQYFAQMVIPYGTMGVVCDPHEIANVLGEEGVRFMMDDAEKSPLNFYFAIPSCVPATPFETSGAKLGSKEIERLIEKSVALGEMMNYPGVIARDSEVMKKLDVAKRHNRPIDGHIPGVCDENLRKYLSAGISTDHEAFSIQEAKEKLKAGMKIIIREGSAARNMEALLPLLLTNIDDIMFCTDDAHPKEISEWGHIKNFYMRAQEYGVSVFDIYKPLLLNPKRHYNLDVGCVQKGDKADFIIVDNLKTMNIISSYLSGNEVFNGKDILFDTTNTSKINNFISRSFSDDDFRVVSKGVDDVQHVIGIVADQLVTTEYLWNPNVREGEEILSSESDDIVKIAVINRYSLAPVANGFIKGTGLKKGVMGCSIAHDSHNVVIIGRDAERMKACAEKVFSMKGGIVVIDDSGEVCSLKLPIAGLMTPAPWKRVARKYQKLSSWARERCCSSLQAPFMTMSFMCLLVIPSIKIGDKGLFDVNKFDFIK